MFKVFLPHVPGQVALAMEGFVAVFACMLVLRVGPFVVPDRGRRTELFVALQTLEVFL